MGATLGFLIFDLASRGLLISFYFVYERFFFLAIGVWNDGGRLTLSMGVFFLFCRGGINVEQCASDTALQTALSTLTPVLRPYWGVCHNLCQRVKSPFLRPPVISLIPCCHNRSYYIWVEGRRGVSARLLLAISLFHVFWILWLVKYCFWFKKKFRYHDQFKYCYRFKRDHY